LECKIPFRLRPFQYADFLTRYDEGLQELLATPSSKQAGAVLAATPAMTTTPTADLTEHDHKAVKEEKRQEELERQRIAAEQARLEGEREQATNTVKARLEQQERERKAAEEKTQQEEFNRQRLAAEEARREEESRQTAVEKSQVQQKERERSGMPFATGVQDRARLLKVRSAPLLIAGIVGAILIVGWLSYWAFSRSHTTPGEIQKKETQVMQSQGAQVLTLRGHSSSVFGVAFSPDGKRLATASWDQRVQVYALDVRE
jgi:hypothetical protein